MSENKSIGIIPARYGSTRFPGKPLAMINGKTMIQRVFEQCQKSKLGMVAVATDDDRIVDAVIGFGGNVIMTDKDLPSGTDRCRAALDFLPFDHDFVINIQGDEPFIEPEQINKVVEVLTHTDAEIATLVSPALNWDEVNNPNRVKAVVQADGKALYFSRSAIPYPRNKEGLRAEDYFIHLGIYGFRKEALEKTGELPLGKLEITEGLEQLRWLENGMSIYTSVTEIRNDAVDTPEDLATIEKKYLL